MKLTSNTDQRPYHGVRGFGGESTLGMEAVVYKGGYLLNKWSQTLI